MFQLLNCDDHEGMLKKFDRLPGTVRPDITHQCLMMLLDSPLNRAGLLQVGNKFVNQELKVIHTKLSQNSLYDYTFLYQCTILRSLDLPMEALFMNIKHTLTLRTFIHEKLSKSQLITRHGML